MVASGSPRPSLQPFLCCMASASVVYAKNSIGSLSTMTWSFSGPTFASTWGVAGGSGYSTAASSGVIPSAMDAAGGIALDGARQHAVHWHEQRGAAQSSPPQCWGAAEGKRGIRLASNGLFFRLDCIDAVWVALLSSATAYRTSRSPSHSFRRMSNTPQGSPWTSIGAECL